MSIPMPPEDALIAGPLDPHSVRPGQLPVAVGQVLDTKYRVDAVLGVGGMGVVVAATLLQLGHRVAIKLMLPEAMKDPSSAERFKREARAVRSLKGEHVARVFDVGELSNGTPYLVMELLDGTDLRPVVKAGPTLPIGHIVGYVLQACEAVAEAHRLGIVHRDIKPHNLFMTRKSNGNACVKVLDFGISKTLDGGVGNDSSLTRTTAVMGSPHYMAPEQMRSARSVDARADVWALGVCLYQFLTGHVPFEAETMLELGGKVLHEEPVPMAQYRGGIPHELEGIVVRCLKKDPSARFENAGELAAALAHFLTGSVSETEWSGPQPAIPPSLGGPRSFGAPRPPGASQSQSSVGSGIVRVPPTMQSGSVAPTGVTVGREGAAAAPSHRPVALVAVGTFVGVLVIVSAALFVFARGRSPAPTAPPPPTAVQAVQPVAPATDTAAPGVTSAPTQGAPAAPATGAAAAPPPTGAAAHQAPPPRPESHAAPPPAKPATNDTPAPVHHTHHSAAPPPGDAFNHM